MVSSIRARAFGMAIGPSGSLEHPRLTGCAGRVLPADRQKFALHLKQTGFDRAGATKSPKQVCQPMNERKLHHGSRIDTADESTLERSVGANIFQIPND